MNTKESDYNEIKQSFEKTQEIDENDPLVKADYYRGISECKKWAAKGSSYIIIPLDEFNHKNLAHLKKIFPKLIVEIHDKPYYKLVLSGWGE